MSFRRAILAPLACLGMVAAIAGCPEGSQPGQAKLPFAGQHVDVLIPSDQTWSAGWTELLQEWSAQTGAHVELKTYALADGWKPLAPDGSDSNQRVQVVPLDWVVELADTGVWTAIPGGPERGYEPADFLTGARQAVQWDRKTTAIPLATSTPLLWYRDDLLRAAGKSPPRTWDEYRALLESLGDWAPGKTAVEPWGAESLATVFWARAAAGAKSAENYSFWFDVDRGASRLSHPGFTAAFTEMERIRPKLAPNCGELGPAECLHELLQGRAALGIAWMPAGPLDRIDGASFPIPTETSLESAAPPGLMAARLPGTPVSKGTAGKAGAEVWAPPLVLRSGLAVGISGLGDAPIVESAALSLLQELIALRLEQAFPASTKTVCRKSQCEMGASWLTDRLPSDLAEAVTRATADAIGDAQAFVELPVVEAATMNRAAATALREQLFGDSPATDATERMQRVEAAFVEAQQIVGAERIRDSYRRSFGLTISQPSAGK